MNRTTVWLVTAFWAMHSSFTPAMNQTFLDYISRYKDIAVREMQRTGIPASIKLAQALQESGAGTSELAREANNHFGIKCHNDWIGDTYYREDDDFDEFGKLRKSCFRVYKSAEQSFVEHSEFLKRPRYTNLFKLDPTDYRGWAKGLREAGYATDPSYANRLIDLIERFNLAQYDLPGAEVGNIPITVRPKPQPNHSTKEDGFYVLNDVKYIAALSGESLQDIARRSGTSVSNLMDFNENGIKPTQLLKGGTRVYIQPKRDYYRGRQKYHVVQTGETMFDIAQLYGVKLDKLYERNRMQSGTQPAANEEVKLRGSKVRNTPRLNREANQRDNSEPEFLFEEPIVSQPAPVREQPKPVTDINRPTPPPPVQENLDEDPFEDMKPPVQPAPQPEALYHVVQEGDTLWNISRRYNLTVETLKKLNNLDSNIIKKGVQLRIQ